MSTNLRPKMVKIARVFGLIGPLVAYTFIGVSIHLNPWFSLEGHALSELGDPRKEYCRYPWFYNIGLEISGVIMALFALGLLARSRSGIGRLGSTLVLFGSISLSLIGIFPSGTQLHVPVTTSFYLLTPIGLLLMALSQIRRDLLASLSIIVTILSSILFASVPKWHGAAIPELIGAIGISISIWILCLRYLGRDQ